jgi:autotransporter-associated beta strand protein
MTFWNPITVSSVTSGRLRIFGEVTASKVTRNCTLTFRNNITLNGDVVFDIPLVLNPDYAQYTNVTYVIGQISGDGALIKENDGSLVLQNTGNTYTGGTVLHLYMGERVSSSEACKQLVKRSLENFRLPYITVTPTFSICPKHGYIAGEHAYCPICDEELALAKRKRLGL